MLIRLIVAAGAALLGSPEGQCLAPVEQMFLGAIASAPETFEGRLVEICGTLGAHGDVDPRERVMSDISPLSGEAYALYVFDPHGELPGEGGRACVVGTSRRRDGLTTREAQARGLPNLSITDVPLSDPEYVFYPLSCGRQDVQGGELGQ